MVHQLELGVIERAQEVVFGAGEEIIETDDIVAIAQQALVQMRAKEAGTTRVERSSEVGVLFH